MILLHVVAESKNQAVEIADYLIENKLLLDAVITEKVVVRKQNKDGKFHSIDQALVMGRTKSLLFNYIDQKLRKRYPDDMPLVYSVAIVNMDWEQSNLLISKTAKA